MSSRYAPLSLPELYICLRQRLWREFGPGEVLAHCGSDDGVNYLCVALNVEDRTVREDVPTYRSTSERDAVEALLAHYEREDTGRVFDETDEAEAPAVKTLRDPFPVARLPEPPLARFVQALTHCTAPADCATCYRAHRAALATLDTPLRDAAWTLCVRRAEEVGTRRGMRRWLQGEIARQDRRETLAARKAVA